MLSVRKFLGCFAFLIATAPFAHSQPFANIELTSNAIAIQTQSDVDAVTVRVVGENYSFQKEFTSSNIVLDLTSLKLNTDGNYQYQVTGITYTGNSQVVSGNGRAPGATMKESQVSTVHGSFDVSGHAILSKF